MSVRSSVRNFKNSDWSTQKALSYDWLIFFQYNPIELGSREVAFCLRGELCLNAEGTLSTCMKNSLEHAHTSYILNRHTTAYGRGRGEAKLTYCANTHSHILLNYVTYLQLQANFQNPTTILKFLSLPLRHSAGRRRGPQIIFLIGKLII